MAPVRQSYGPHAGITDSHHTVAMVEQDTEDDQYSMSANRPSCRRVGHLGRQRKYNASCKSSLGCYSRLGASNQPDYHLSTKTETTNDLRSLSALVPVTRHGRAILHSPIHTSHPQICLSISRQRHKLSTFSLSLDIRGSSDIEV